MIDFGIAWTLDLGSLTATGALLGTPRCMAPEQILGRKALEGPATDVWALGVLLYRLLADTPPFDAASFAVLREAIVRASPPPLRGLDPEVPASLEAIVGRCLAREPRDRYPDAAALALDLDRALSGQWRAGPSRRAVHAAAFGTAGVALLAAAVGSAPLAEHAPGRVAPTATPTTRAVPDEEAVAALERQRSLGSLSLDRAQNVRWKASAPALYRLGLAKGSRAYLEAAHRLDAAPEGLAREVARFWRAAIESDESRHRSAVLFGALDDPERRARRASLARAFAGFAEAFERAPDVAPPWATLQTLRLESHSSPAFAREVLAAWPGNPTLALLEARDEDRESARRLESVERGLAFLRRVARDEHPEARLLGKLLARAGFYLTDLEPTWDVALGYAREAHETLPDAESRHMLSWALEKNALWAELVARFPSAAEDPASEDSRMTLALLVHALCELGRPEEARAITESVARRNPDFRASVEPFLERAAK